MATHADHHVELSTQEAREGEGSPRTAWVLRASLALAVIAGLVVYFTYFRL